MINVTILSADQVWGFASLQVIKESKYTAGSSDLAVVLGSDLCETYTITGDYATTYWTKSLSGTENVEGVNYYGSVRNYEAIQNKVSIRPVLPASEVAKIPSSTKINEFKIGLINSDMRICEFGEYPQTLADKKTSETLESLYNDNNLATTPKKYTFNVDDTDAPDIAFNPKAHREYELDGQRYIRVQGKGQDSMSILSNHTKVQKGATYWIKVEPIEWLMDRSGVWVSKKCLVAGVPFDTKGHYDGDFSKTLMKSYLDTYFSKEMLVRDFAKETAKAKDILSNTTPQNVANNYGEVQNIDTEMLISIVADMDFEYQNAVFLARIDEISQDKKLLKRIQNSMERTLQQIEPSKFNLLQINLLNNIASQTTR